MPGQRRVEEKESAVPHPSAIQLNRYQRSLGKIPQLVQGLCTWGFNGWASWSSVNLLKLYVHVYIFQRRMSIVSIGFSWGIIILITPTRLRITNVVSESISGILKEKLFLKPPNSFVYSSLILRTLSDNLLSHVVSLQGKSAVSHWWGALGSTWELCFSLQSKKWGHWERGAALSEGAQEQVQQNLGSNN